MVTAKVRTQADGLYRIRAVLRTAEQPSVATMRSIDFPGQTARFRVKSVAMDGTCSPWAVQLIVVAYAPLASVVGFRLCGVDVEGRRSPWVEVAVMTGQDESSPGADLIHSSLTSLIRGLVRDDAARLFAECSLTNRLKFHPSDDSGYSAGMFPAEHAVLGLAELSSAAMPTERLEEVIGLALQELLSQFAAPVEHAEPVLLSLVEDAAAFHLLHASPSSGSTVYEDLLLSYAEAYLIAGAGAKLRDLLSADYSGDETGAFIRDGLEVSVEALVRDSWVQPAASSSRRLGASEDRGETLEPSFPENVFVRLLESFVASKGPSAVEDALARIFLAEKLDASFDAVPVRRASEDLGRFVLERVRPVSNAFLDVSRVLDVLDSSILSPAASLSDVVFGLMRGEVWSALFGEGFLDAFGSQEFEVSFEEAQDLFIDFSAFQRRKGRLADASGAVQILPVSELLVFGSLILDGALAMAGLSSENVESLSILVGHEVLASSGAVWRQESSRLVLARRVGAVASLGVEPSSRFFTASILASPIVLPSVSERRRLKVADYYVSAQTGPEFGTSTDKFIMGRFIMGVTPMGD